MIANCVLMACPGGATVSYITHCLSLRELLDVVGPNLSSQTCLVTRKLRHWQAGIYSTGNVRDEIQLYWVNWCKVWLGILSAGWKTHFEWSHSEIGENSFGLNGFKVELWPRASLPRVGRVQGIAVRFRNE